MTSYIDASALVATLVPEVRSSDVRRFLSGGPGPWLVSEFAAAEVSAALSRLLRLGTHSMDTVVSQLAFFDRWRVTEAVEVAVTADDLRTATAMVRRFELKLLAPDALHIAIARRIAATLVTLDDRQADAAEALGLAVDRLSA